ncbi:MAG: OB-fold nucleic acid binding domain-containing protein, partial [Candidatus Azambacteria bacterium]|nr:OB-fold nucleic acid binding domain-containing protein [Candidatus Azambacteria bacterium]
MPTLEELRKIRIQKLESLKADHKNLYPSNIKRDFFIKTVFNKFWLWKLIKKEFYLAGRIKSIRVHGQAAFFDLEDNSEKIQCFLNPKDLKNKIAYDEFLANF